MEKVKDGKARSYCCPLWDQSTGQPSFGVSILSPFTPSLASSSSLSPILQLFGLSDREMQDQITKKYSYAFNMGNNNNISFQNYKEAAEVLMQRNMPDVLHNRQTKAVFQPDTHLPDLPRALDEERYKARKEDFDETNLLYFGMKKEGGDLDTVRGNLIEEELFQELKQFYKDKKVVVFWGPKLRLPGKAKGSHQEFDFVIVDLDLKAVIGIESKASLNKSSKGSAAAQTKSLKELLEKLNI